MPYVTDSDVLGEFDIVFTVQVLYTNSVFVLR